MSSPKVKYPAPLIRRYSLGSAEDVVIERKEFKELPRRIGEIDPEVQAILERIDKKLEKERRKIEQK